MKKTLTKIHRMTIGVSVVIFSFFALFAWALASPVGSSPDDNFHLSSIWCGAGDKKNQCDVDSQGNYFVPEGLYTSADCYAYDSSKSAICQNISQNETSVFEAAPHSNQEQTYPPGYYFVLSQLVSSDIQSSVLLIRALNAALFVSLISITFIMVNEKLKKSLSLGFLFLAIPLGTFIIPSTNPSSWSIIALSIFWVAFLAFLETDGRRKIALGLLLVLTSLLATQSRADSAIYLIISAALVLIHVGIKKFKETPTAAFLILLLLLSSISLLFSGQTEALNSGLNSGMELEENQNFFYLLFFNFFGQPWLWTGVLGTWPLGWLDTPINNWVSILLVSSAAFMFYWSLRGTKPWRNKGFIFVWGSVWLIPFVILMRSEALIGTEVQPRYILPLLIVAYGYSVYIGNNKQINLYLVLVFTFTLSISNSFALLAVMNRYIFGRGNGETLLSSSPEWWWNFGFTPLTVWIIGSLSFLFATLGIFVLTNSRRPDSLIIPKRFVQKGLRS